MNLKKQNLIIQLAVFVVNLYSILTKIDAASFESTINNNNKNSKSPQLSRVRTKGNFYVDENDRVLLFHGVNAVAKTFPWVPDSTGNVNDNCKEHCDLTNKTQLTYLRAMGFNVVRVGFMWSGLFVRPGVVNESYVNEMLTIVSSLEEFGMYVILDLHQDQLSSKFNSCKIQKYFF